MEQLVVLLEIGRPDHKNVDYPLPIIEDAINAFNKRIKRRNGMLGECGIPPDLDSDGRRMLKIDLSRASHIVRHVWIQNNIVKAKIFLLGKYAEIAEEMNIRFLAIPRAYGEVDAKGTCTKYTLITVDLVLPDPE